MTVHSVGRDERLTERGLLPMAKSPPPATSVVDTAGDGSSGRVSTSTPSARYRATHVATVDG